ncbi:hypothetical protein EB796_014844 [Bugula neritina]|uniref:Uncharacterized protein n=1 Tax=Bugula neritina TaxID=10212 RepID=A0A7J7JKL8_BUGNE|nr:hypothetical protein EB796_014844 [Bugula neritina]
MCSLLLNTLSYLHQRLEEAVPVLLSVVDTLSPHLSIYSHYCQVFSLQQSHSTENGAETHFVLYELSNEESTSSTCRLSFTQSHGNIKLTKLELVNRSTPIL